MSRIPGAPSPARATEGAGFCSDQICAHRNRFRSPKPQGLRRANHKLSFGASRQAAGTNCQLESCTAAPGDLFHPWHTRIPPILAFRDMNSLSSAAVSPWIFARADAAASVRIEAAAAGKIPLLNPQNSSSLLAQVTASLRTSHNYNFSKAGEKKNPIDTAQKTTLCSCL